MDETGDTEVTSETVAVAEPPKKETVSEEPKDQSPEALAKPFEQGPFADTRPQKSTEELTQIAKDMKKRAEGQPTAQKRTDKLQAEAAEKLRTSVAGRLREVTRSRSEKEGEAQPTTTETKAAPPSKAEQVSSSEAVGTQLLPVYIIESKQKEGGTPVATFTRVDMNLGNVRLGVVDMQPLSLPTPPEPKNPNKPTAITVEGAKGPTYYELYKPPEGSLKRVQEGIVEQNFQRQTGQSSKEAIFVTPIIKPEENLGRYETVSVANLLKKHDEKMKTKAAKQEDTASKITT